MRPQAPAIACEGHVNPEATLRAELEADRCHHGAGMAGSAEETAVPGLSLCMAGRPEGKGTVPFFPCRSGTLTEVISVESRSEWFMG
jgi:hypothetical protein